MAMQSYSHILEISEFCLVIEICFKILVFLLKLNIFNYKKPDGSFDCCDIFNLIRNIKPPASSFVGHRLRKAGVEYLELIMEL